MEISEKTLWDKCFESMSEDEYCSTTLERLNHIFHWYLLKKAAAYDRLMSGGKKTLKEWANIFGMPIAVDQDGEASSFAHVPVMRLDDGEGIWTNNPKHYGEETYLLPPHLIDYSGDWKDSLTLPDGWEEK